MQLPHMAWKPYCEGSSANEHALYSAQRTFCKLYLAFKGRLRRGILSIIHDQQVILQSLCICESQW